jgi:hypothetical protein
VLTHYVPHPLAAAVSSDQFHVSSFKYIGRDHCSITACGISLLRFWVPQCYCDFVRQITTRYIFPRKILKINVGIDNYRSFNKLQQVLKTIG